MKELMLNILFNWDVNLFERYSKDSIFTGWWPHAYETTAIAKAGSAMRLIRRCFVIVEGEVRLAGRWIHADRVADQNFTLAALAQLGTFWFILAIQLHTNRAYTDWFQSIKCISSDLNLFHSILTIWLQDSFFSFFVQDEKDQSSGRCVSKY